MNNRNDGEKYHQQRSKRQCFFKRMTDAPFFNNPVKSGKQDDNHQTNNTDFCQVQRQG